MVSLPSCFSQNVSTFRVICVKLYIIMERIMKQFKSQIESQLREFKKLKTHKNKKTSSKESLWKKKICKFKTTYY